MGKIKDIHRFAGIEWLLQDYFKFHLAPVMERVRSDLTRRQAEEMRDFSCSTAGILSFMASSQMPMGDPYQLLKVTGEWNSKTTEDYVEMCRKAILGNKTLQKDLALMAHEWRKAVIEETGRERYDECSSRIGCDLAYAYVSYRVEQQMIDKLVKDGMPKSSADYIIRKAAGTSLFGLQMELYKTPLDKEIEARGEAAYGPSKIEKGAGWALGTATDALAMGGAGSWSSFLKLVGFDIGLTAITGGKGGNGEAVPTDEGMETCISKGVFGSDVNVFNEIRDETKKIQPHEDAYIADTNGKLAKQIPIVDFELGFMGWDKQNNNAFPFKTFTVPGGYKRDEKYKDVPLIVAPGHEEAYLKEKAEMEAEQARREAEEAEQEEKEKQEAGNAGIPDEPQTAEDMGRSDGKDKATNENGWEGLLANFGLDGMGDIGQNLGYVLAMLPDLLVGIFTGKTHSLGLKDNLMPIASIAAGLFVKNPLLKMLLVGLGGMNLLNKAGHEALERKEKEEIPEQVRYKTYPDEPLNPRIVQPVLRGNSLVATIDKVPCTVQLSGTVADAYRAGALPLNTLANAVLARHDRMQRMAEQNYEQSEGTAIHRTRGIQ